MLEKAVAFSHSLLKKTVQAGDLVIDATIGNGNDTVLLASLVGKTGKVIGFDIQEDAVQKTTQKLLLTGLAPQVEIHQMSHEFAADFIPGNKKISAAIFNLGYLPGGDKTVTTKKDSTIHSIDSLLPFLHIGGLLIIVVYSGHDAGKEEKESLLEYVSTVDQEHFDVLLYQFLNQKNNPPFVLAIERKKPKQK